jgi:hypothetical protein
MTEFKENDIIYCSHEGVRSCLRFKKCDRPLGNQKLYVVAEKLTNNSTWDFKSYYSPKYCTLATEEQKLHAIVEMLRN